MISIITKDKEIAYLEDNSSKIKILWKNGDQCKIKWIKHMIKVKKDYNKSNMKIV